MAHNQLALAISGQHDSYYYYLYGLNIRSELRLPTAITLSSPPFVVDAEIIIGQAPDFTVASSSAEAYFQFRKGAALFVAPGAARYLIEGGARIVVQLEAGASEDDVYSQLLLGPVCGILLHQRRYVALHASAIATEYGAAIFMGSSGSGKSTLLAALQRLGHRMLTDEVCAIKFDAPGGPLLYPGPAQLKLWGDAAATLGYNITWRPCNGLTCSATST